LQHGSLAATLDPGLFTRILGVPPSPTDAATHVANTAFGPRPIQGYAMGLLLLPGWALAGRLGAGIVIAVVGALASWQTLLLLRDLVRERIAGWTWVMGTALLPAALLATHLYPNIVGALLVAAAFRAGFTAPRRRPALATTLLALTLFLNPRDGLALLTLGPFLLVRGPRARVLVAGIAVALVAIAANGVLYGVPLPYAGYLFGTAEAQAVTHEPSIVPSFWIGLPAILFDRDLGLAGSAPWLFVGLLGLAAALRRERERLLPAAITVGAGLVALSFFRLWEGGYAPPGRYFVDVLPLWLPFVAYGLAAAQVARGAASLVVRAFVGAVLAVSALTAFVLSAVPSLALNSAFDDKIRDAMARILGIDPLGWLPSFQPLEPTWWVDAYLATIPALALCAWLVWSGIRYEPSEEVRPVGSLEIGGVSSKEAREQAASDESGARRRTSELLVFLVANLVAIAWIVVAASQPSMARPGDPIPESLFRKWLPFAMALATLGTAVIIWVLPRERRGTVLARHFALYLGPLALLVAWHFGQGSLLNGQLGALYLLIPLAFAVHAASALWTALDRLSDRAIATSLATIALVAAFALLPYERAVMPTASDEPHYLVVVQSLVVDHSLNVAKEYGTPERYRSFYPAVLPDIHGIHVGDAIYSIRDLGMPFLLVLPFAVAGRLGALALMCLVGVALTLQLYLLTRELGFGKRAAFLGVASTALVHPILTYTTQIYPELLTALAFVTAVRLLRAGTGATPRQLALASAVVGTLPWLSTRAWPTVVGVGLVIAYCAWWPGGRTRGDIARRTAAGALPFAALVLALCTLNWRTFGLFMPAAGYFLIRNNQPVLVYTVQVGATGLLFDRTFGLIPRAPVYLLAFLGAPLFLRRARARSVELVALAAGALLSFVYIAAIAYWWADGSPPSRYLLASLPLLVPAVAAGWEIVLGDGLPAAWRTLARAASWLALAASAGVVYVFGVLPNVRYDLALDILKTGSSGHFFELVRRSLGVDPGKLFPSLVRIDPAHVALAVIWTAIAIALAAIGSRSYGPRARARRAGAPLPRG
ncbi:MAG: hypothetical protein KGJ98_12910, partial [Chloroflexota bacterium]|nr:hypothetical protein [Chloroflexota bacterium]